MTTIYAHRGMHGGDVAENSWRSFEIAADAGFGIETDVRILADGTPALVHDRCIDGRRVDDMTADELTHGQGHEVVDLATFLSTDWRVPINIEIKTWDAAQAALPLLLRSGDARIMVSSFDHQVISFLGVSLPMRFGHLMATRPSFTAPLPESEAGTRQGDAIVWDWNIFHADMAPLTRMAGRRCIVYGTHTADEHRAVLDAGVDGIITDHPELAAAVLADAR